MSGPALTISRRDALVFRLGRHGLLDASPSDTQRFETAPVLDLGVPDSGADGSTWALANRGIHPADPDDVLLVWTLRGAPHVYRRTDVAAVAVATAPFSEADARSRVFDASKPLIAAGIEVLSALATVAEAMRDVVGEPTAKGDVSTTLTARLPEPYLRHCRPCDTTHLYEQPFRLAALQAGLELAPGTSPPVMRRIPGFDPLRFAAPGTAAEARHDVLRVQLRLSGPIRRADTAKVADAPRKDVAAHWPDDIVEVAITDEDVGPRAEPRHLLAGDVEHLHATAGDAGRGTRLLGPFDPYLQLQDRTLLLPDERQRKDLWRVLGRPGAIIHDGEIVGTWRPRAKAKSLTVAVTPWVTLSGRASAAIETQAELLAAHREVSLAGVAWD